MSVQQDMRRIRQSIPQGYFLGRLSAGVGPVEAIQAADLATHIVSTGIAAGGSGSGQQWSAGQVGALSGLVITNGTLTFDIDSSLTLAAGILKVTALPGVTSLGTVVGGPTLLVSGSTLVAKVTQGTLYDVAVDLATTAALSPANTYSNGASGVGATLTGTSNGNPAIDGTNITAGMLVLINNEANSANNGIYIVTKAGSGSTPYILTRLPGVDNPTALVYTSCYTGGAGNDNNFTVFLSGNAAPITIGSTGLAWAPPYSAGSNGVQISDGAIFVNWNAGVVGSLGTVAGGATLAISGGTLTCTTPADKWGPSSVTSLGTVSGGYTLSVASGTLSVSGSPPLAGSMNLNSGTLSNVGRGTLTLSGTTTGTISTTLGFSTYLVNVGTANGTISLGSSTNLSSPLRLDILQGATAHLVAFDTTVIAGTDITGFTATTTAGLYDMVELIPATNGKWRIGAVAHGYAA